MHVQQVLQWVVAVIVVVALLLFLSVMQSAHSYAPFDPERTSQPAPANTTSIRTMITNMEDMLEERQQLQGACQQVEYDQMLLRYSTRLYERLEQSSQSYCQLHTQQCVRGYSAVIRANLSVDVGAIHHASC